MIAHRPRRDTERIDDGTFTVLPNRVPSESGSAMCRNPSASRSWARADRATLRPMRAVPLWAMLVR